MSRIREWQFATVDVAMQHHPILRHWSRSLSISSDVDYTLELIQAIVLKQCMSAGGRAAITWVYS